MVAKPSPRNAPRNACAINVLISLICGLALLACSSEPPPPAVQAPPPVDPRYASAEALGDHISAQIDQLSGGNLASFREIMGLYYAETPEQERIASLMTELEAVVGLVESAVASYPDFRQAFEMGLQEAARQREAEGLVSNHGAISNHTGRRALLTFPGSSSDEDGLHLVEVGGRWWISGYSFEYTPGFQQFMSGVNMAQLEQFARSVGREARALQGKINSGSFADSQQFFLAASGAFMTIAAENPDAEQLFEDLQEQAEQFTGGRR